MSKEPYSTSRTAKRIRNVSDLKSVELIQEERLRESEYINEEKESKKESKRLSKKDFTIFRFTPGKRDDDINFVTRPININYSIQVPDHTLEKISDPVKVQELREKTISLGHSGEIILKVKEVSFYSSTMKYILQHPSID